MPSLSLSLSLFSLFAVNYDEKKREKNRYFLFQTSLTCLLGLAIIETVITVLSNTWSVAVVLIFVDAVIAALLLWRQCDSFLLSWIIVACSIIVLIIAPLIKLFCFSLLFLFLCYTLLPLELIHSLLAAILITTTTIIICYLNLTNVKEVRKIN